MENSIARPYEKILNWTSLFSGIINFITVFFPIFQVNIFGFSETELGIKYLLPFINSGNESSFMKYLQDSSFLKILLSLILILLLSSAFILCIIPIFNLMDKKINGLSNRSALQSCHSKIIIAFIINALYYLTSVITVFIVMNDWHFKPVITYSYIPFILQLIVLIISVSIYKHYKKAVCGQISPLSFSASSAPIIKQQSTEDDKVNLIIKYKELLDNDVINEEEYKEIKEKILKGDL